MSKFAMYITSLLHRHIVIMDDKMVPKMSIAAFDSGRISIGDFVFDRDAIAMADWDETEDDDAYYLFRDTNGCLHKVFFVKCESLDAMRDLKNELYAYD